MFLSCPHVLPECNKGGMYVRRFCKCTFKSLQCRMWLTSGAMRKVARDESMACA